MTNTENDIIPSFHFRVVFTGLKGITDLDTRFESVAGIQGQRPVEVTATGKNKEKESDPDSFQPLVLRRAALTPQSSPLLQWALKCLNTHRYSALPEVQVQVLNELQQPQLIIRLKDTTLKSWALSGLDARVSGILMEEFQLEYKAIDITTG